MARKVFYSFHYIPDNWRVSQVRNIGAIEDNKPAKDNDWETIRNGGEAAIKKWIAEQMAGRTCAVVLVGAETAGRKWINYEINKAWEDGKGVVAVYIHNLKNIEGKQTSKGGNPFAGLVMNGKAKVYDPPFVDSKDVYAHISANLADWVEEAIKIRANN